MKSITRKGCSFISNDLGYINVCEDTVQHITDVDQGAITGTSRVNGTNKVKRVALGLQRTCTVSKEVTVNNFLIYN